MADKEGLRFSDVNKEPPRDEENENDQHLPRSWGKLPRIPRKQTLKGSSRPAVGQQTPSENIVREEDKGGQVQPPPGTRERYPRKVPEDSARQNVDQSLPMASNEVAVQPTRFDQRSTRKDTEPQLAAGKKPPRKRKDQERQPRKQER